MAATKPSDLHALSSLGIAGLQFVVSTGAEKPDPELRKLIRSHVMLGKNAGRTLVKTRTPRKRESKRLQDMSSLSSDISSEDTFRIHGDIVESSPSSGTVTCSVNQVQHPSPRNFGCFMSGIQLADAVEPAAVEVLLQFSSLSKHILFPLKARVLVEGSPERWIAPLVLDPVYLHLMIFISQYYFDAILPRKPSHATQRMLPHFLATLRLLRERLAHDDNQAKLSSTTTAVVMNLTALALLMGDLGSAKHHLGGLCKIVNLSGGISALRNNAKLLVEILKCDITMAFSSGSRSLFFDNVSSREPLPPYPDLISLLGPRQLPAADSLYASTTFLDNANDELVRAWTTMSDFCSVIDFASESGQRITTETFLDAMSAVVYRLLNVDIEPGSFDDAIRLGLLAFSCSTFLQWKHLGMSYPHLASTFRNCLRRLMTTSLPPHVCSSQLLLLWLLMIGAVSVFDVAAVDNKWLKPYLLTTIEICEIDSWEQMRGLLKSILWVDLVHDEPGKAVFDSLSCLL